MKTLNFIAFICFAVLSVVAGVFTLILKRIDLECISFICGSISYVAYKDFCDPQQI
jgi:hypothetical protein